MNKAQFEPFVLLIAFLVLSMPWFWKPTEQDVIMKNLACEF